MADQPISLDKSIPVKEPPGRGDLLDMPIRRALFTLAWPTVLAVLLEHAATTVDMIMVGRLGAVEIASVVFSSMINWTLTAAVSNKPLNLGVVEASAFVANLFDSAALTAIGGLSAGLLGGSKQTRAGATLEALLGLMFARAPFDIDAVDIQLENMVITNISRTKTPENEQAIEFVAELMELPLISTVISTNQPAQSELRDGDPAKTQAAADVNKGEVGTEATSIADAVSAGLIL